MTTYGYVRVSTDNQTTDSQILALVRAGVESRHIESDDGVSGMVPAMERPGFACLLASVKRGDTVVVYSLSRVGRSTLDVLTMVNTLVARGVTFRSLTEPFDTSTPIGVAMLSILAAFAQLERDMTVERTKAGLAAAKARGVTFGPKVDPARRDAVLAALARHGQNASRVARELGLPLTSVRRIRDNACRPEVGEVG